MEYRKIIAFGKSSFVISLPKSWVRQNKLKKGDLVYLDESGANLTLAAKESENQSEEKECVIIIDGKSTERLRREVNSAYIQNIRTIIFKGRELKSKVKELQQVIQSLIALEIMEQGSDSVIARDFLNMDKVSILELIKKMDVVTRTMLKETCNIFQEDNYQSINDRDDDVNRLYFLLYRTVLYNMENATRAIKNFNYTPVGLLHFHRIGFHLEGAADEVRRIARIARQLQLSPKEKKFIESFLERLSQYYMDTMKAVNMQDKNLALQLSDSKQTLAPLLDDLDAKNRAVEDYPVLTSRVRRFISHVHNLGQQVYT
ncbi:phosphate uptake regulator PhoU [Candidatus Woesearchaeota archaeon]|nr:phosphate uptake regulator PhoU [Candidatus Woesearchaeota archaeon]